MGPAFDIARDFTGGALLAVAGSGVVGGLGLRLATGPSADVIAVLVGGVAAVAILRFARSRAHA